MEFNPTTQRLKESETLQLNAQVAALQARGVRVVNLTAGELNFPTPRHVQAAVRKHLRENHYTATLGLSELRANIAADVSRRYGQHFTADEVGVTAGAKQALAETFQLLLARGREAVIPVPAWVSYEQQVRLALGVPVFVRLTPQFDLDPVAIARALTSRTRVVVVNSPHNPTGRIFSAAALRELGRLVCRHPRLSVVADDIYLPLVPEPTPPITRFIPKRQLVIVNGFSKSVALTGWRVGYVAAPRPFIDLLGRMQSHVSGNAALPSQVAALAALRQGPSPRFRAELARRRALAVRLLQAVPQLSFVPPQGAFYVFLDLRRLTRRSAAFCAALLKREGVALVPGEAFRAPGFARLSYAASPATIRRGVANLARFVAAY